MRLSLFQLFLALFHFLFLTAVGRIVFGLLLIAAGSFYGFTSHQVVFHSHSLGSGKIYVGGDGVYYIKDNQDQTYYTMATNDFTPFPNNIWFQDDTTLYISSLVYDTAPTHVDTTLLDDTHLSGPGHAIVELKIYSKNMGHNEFTTDQYRHGPTGYYDNRWIAGGIAAALGVFLWLVSLLLICFPRLNPAINRPGSDDTTTRHSSYLYHNSWARRTVTRNRDLAR